MLVSEGVDEDRVDKSTEGAEGIGRALLSAAQTLKMCPHRSEMLPTTPEMRLKQMAVGVFDRNQVAGSASTGSLSAAAETRFAPKVRWFILLF
jgi:hypothetical protein